jgi:hypothetical protein
MRRNTPKAKLSETYRTAHGVCLLLLNGIAVKRFFVDVSDFKQRTTSSSSPPLAFHLLG